MKTYRLTEKDIENKPVLAVGYKAFAPKWGTKHGDYCYADETGNVLDTIHTVDGNIAECCWGLHFSKKPQDCFNFYESVQWNNFAKVEAYDACLDSSDGKKSVAKTLKIIKTYTFDEFIRLIQEDLQSSGVNESNGVSYSNGVNGSNGVNVSSGVNCSFGVDESDGVNWSDGVSYSNGVNGSNGVNKSNGVNGSNGVHVSSGVNRSNGVRGSNGVNKSSGVNESNGVSYSNGVNCSFGVTKCKAVSRCIFCQNQEGARLKLFNKRTTMARHEAVLRKIFSFNWYPKFNNAEELKGDLEWYETNIPAIVRVPNEVAWSFMPKEMKEYLQSLPEYDEAVFKKVTGKIDE
jgi:hypothetical protein